MCLFSWKEAGCDLSALFFFPEGIIFLANFAPSVILRHNSPACAAPALKIPFQRPLANSQVWGGGVGGCWVCFLGVLGLFGFFFLIP